MAYAQSTGNPFNLPNRGGPGPSATAGPELEASRRRWEQQQGIGAGGGAGGGAPTPLQFTQQIGGQGMEMAQNPVMPMMPPPLPQPMGLAEMLGILPSYQPLGSYGAGNWQLPSYGQPGPQAAPGAPGAAGGVPGAGQPGPPMISTGITQPQFSGPPQVPQAPAAPPWMMGGGGGGYQDAYAQAISPLMSGLEGQYYQQQAPIQQGFEGAQAQAGIGWAGLFEQQRQQQEMDQLRRFQMLQGYV